MMPETKTNRLEMQKCITNIVTRIYYGKDENNNVVSLLDDPDFKILVAIANQEVHPSGDQSLLTNASSLKWTDLCHMSDVAYETHIGLGRENIDTRLLEVHKLLEAEKKRRLLALLDK